MLPPSSSRTLSSLARLGGICLLLLLTTALPAPAADATITAQGINLSDGDRDAIQKTLAAAGIDGAGAEVVIEERSVDFYYLLTVSILAAKGEGQGRFSTKEPKSPGLTKRAVRIASRRATAAYKAFK